MVHGVWWMGCVMMVDCVGHASVLPSVSMRTARGYAAADVAFVCVQAAASLVGQKLAELCKAKNIEKVSFDRGGFAYHGRVKVGGWVCVNLWDEGGGRMHGLCTLSTSVEHIVYAKQGGAAWLIGRAFPTPHPCPRACLLRLMLAVITGKEDCHLAMCAARHADC